MIAILRSVSELRAWRAALAANLRVGFVPTMGALHEGHTSLMVLSKAQCDVTIASIFVNPLQFGPNEDLAKYPRPIEADIARLEAAGVDALFLPGVADLYPEGASTYVVEETVSLPLCGEMRPGHFRGVTTVVLKLFNLVQPHVAFFGQKDAQQCAVIERMVRDLMVPVEIVRGDIIREADGLALSSRNIYLTPEQRAVAPVIQKSLRAVAAALAGGERRGARLVEIGRTMIEAEPLLRLQYWEIREPSSLVELDAVGDAGALMAVAAYLGTTRLIDNLLVPAA